MATSVSPVTSVAISAVRSDQGQHPSGTESSSSSSSRGGPVAAEATVRLSPSQRNGLDHSSFEWGGKRYKVYVLDAQGNQLSTTQAQWDRIKNDLLNREPARAQFLNRMHEQYDSFQAETVQSASWRLEDAGFAVNFDRSSTPRIAGTLAGVAQQAFTGLRSTVLSAFPSGSADAGSRPSSSSGTAPHTNHTPSPRPTPALQPPTPPPRTTPHSAPAITPLPLRGQIRGRLSQNHTAVHALGYDGRNSCTVNAAVALTSMLRNQVGNGNDMDGILHRSIPLYQSLIPEYQRRNPSVSRTHPPLMDFPFLLRSDLTLTPDQATGINQNIALEMTDDIDRSGLLTRGQERQQLEARLIELQTACNTSCAVGQSIGAIFTVSRRTFAVKVTKTASNQFSYELYDSHSDGWNNGGGASLRTFTSPQELAALLSRHFQALPVTDDQQLAADYRRMNPSSSAAQVHQYVRDTLDDIVSTNSMGMHIVRLRPPAAAASSAGAALPAGSQ